MAHVTLVHGMANKPPADVMLKLWLRALARDDPKPEIHLPPNAGLDLGTIGASVDSVYWADVLYGTPETDVSGYERGGNERKSIEGVAGRRHDGCSHEGCCEWPVARGAFARRGDVRAPTRGAAALRDRRRDRCRYSRGRRHGGGAHPAARISSSDR